VLRAVARYLRCGVVNMKQTIAILIALAAVGCKHNDASEAEPAASPSMRSDKTAAANPAADKAVADVPADNTGKNARDRNSAALTPMDQGENEVDRTISQQIRSEVVKADEMSMTGKNVKIITLDGVVTLRGPVATAREKQDIINIVKHVDGVKRVDNQLEVAAK
jgi:hyperosmotically inducible protein